ncbi:mobile mystery protein A [Pedobacter frigoris]|uniref:Mobile mystery protein A n=1 Tax=Pedobacter frigoris TaxID=2571272 RepID=A0A4V5P1L4_9SPHI|nr:mobile mystery protein A [Pedobacter frigoris]TKC07128.1 mobile mystery protein A [Pedobacter frigoris]
MKLKNSKLMMIRQLDKKLRLYGSLSVLSVPSSGWINSVRKALNMSLRQFGQYLSISPQGVKDLERRESEGSISLKSLREAGEAINMKLVYGFVPMEGSLETMIENRARKIAIEIVKRTSVTMSLEDQANTNERLTQAVEEMTQDLKREIPKSLWD